MTLLRNRIEEIKNFPKENIELLKKIIDHLTHHLNGKREIMYSDIINLISRRGTYGEKYNELLLWCNYKIRLGEIIVNL